MNNRANVAIFFIALVTVQMERRARIRSTVFVCAAELTIGIIIVYRKADLTKGFAFSKNVITI